MIKIENKNSIRYFLDLTLSSEMNFHSKSKIFLKYNHQGQNQIRLFLNNNKVHYVKVNDTIILDKKKKYCSILFDSCLLNDKSENFIEIFMSGQIKQKKFIKSMKPLFKENKVKYLLKSQINNEYIPHFNIPKLISKHKIKIKIPSGIKVAYNLEPHYKQLIKNFKYLYFETNNIYPSVPKKTKFKLFCFKDFHLTNYNFSI